MNIPEPTTAPEPLTAEERTAGSPVPSTAVLVWRIISRLAGLAIIIYGGITAAPIPVLFGGWFLLLAPPVYE